MTNKTNTFDAAHELADEMIAEALEFHTDMNTHREAMLEGGDLLDGSAAMISNWENGHGAIEPRLIGYLRARLTGYLRGSYTPKF